MFDIIEAKYIDEYKVRLVFENGATGEVDLQEYAQKGGVFSGFRNKNYFMKLYVNKDLGTICWPDGQDIAPETLLAKLK